MWNIKRIIHKIRGDMDIERLIKRGLVLGDNCFINFGCAIDETFCWLIEIGNNVTLAPHVHILAHDASTKRVLGYTKLGGVKIHDNVFIGARSIILPGVEIGENSIIGAGSVIVKDVPDNVVVAGNPAQILCSTEEYIEKQRRKMESAFLYDGSYTIMGNVSEEKKQKMKREIVCDKVGYIK